jgi:hypothetical protein
MNRAVTIAHTERVISVDVEARKQSATANRGGLVGSAVLHTEAAIDRAHNHTIQIVIVGIAKSDTAKTGGIIKFEANTNFTNRCRNLFL